MEENFKILFENMTTPVLIKDENLNFLYVSKGFEDIFGQSAESLVGKSTKDIMDAKSAKAIEVRERKVLESGKPLEVEEKLEFNNNKKLNGCRKFTPIVLADGKPALQIEVILTDEVQKKLDRLQANEAAKNKEADLANQRLKSGIETLDMGFVIWDNEDKLVVCNEAFRKQFAYLTEASIGQSAADLILEFAKSGVVEEAVGREEEWAQELLDVREEELGKEIIFETHDGRWMKRLDQKNDLGDRVGIRVDITDLVKANKAAQLADAVLDASPIAVIVKDVDGKFQVMNKAFAELFNCDPTECIGHRATAVVSAEDAKQFEAREQRILESGEKFEEPEQIFCADGELRNYVTSLNRVHDKDGNPYVCVSITNVDELSKARHEVEESKSRIEAFADTAADWFWETDKEHIVTHITAGMENVLGIPLEHFVGKSRKEFSYNNKTLNEGDHKKNQEDMDERRPFKDFTYRLENAKGEEIWISVSGNPVFAENGDFEGYMGSGRDVTVSIENQLALVEAQSAIEAALKEQQRTTETLNESTSAMAQGLIVFGTENIEYSSEKAASLLEVPEELLTAGSKIMDYLEFAKDRGDYGEGDEAEAKIKAIFDDITNSRPHSFNRKTPSGKSMLIVGESRRGGGLVVTISDVTEMAELQSELEQNKDRIEAFAETSADWFWELDENLCFSYHSDKYHKVTGIKPEDVNGKSLAELNVVPLDEEAFAEALVALENHQPIRDLILEVVGPDGVKRWVAKAGTPTFDNDGKFTGYLGSGSDVSDRVSKEQQLEAARAEALAADRAKSEFLANMSHEIRTPMNGVMGMAELLAKTNLDTKQKNFTDIIVKSGSALLTIINDILDFSKIDAGQMELDPAPFTLSESIEDVATLFSSRVAEKDLEMIMRVEPNLPMRMVGDVGRLRQIITNLVGNAVKFTETGHIFIEVTGQGNPEGFGGMPMQRVRFSVQDTGIGIPAEKTAKIFEKFSQVDTSASRKHEGTGLGLAISSSLVNLMGGQMMVTSEEGEGSTFYFEIDLPIHDSGTVRKAIPVDVTGSRILVVDDNEVNRSILTEQMDAWKFDNAAAADGQEALAFMRAAKSHNIDIDAIILDYHMPEMNGGEMVRAMRAEPAIADIPVIMLTSVDETEDGKAFSSLAIQGHLTKPARSSALLEKIIEVLQEQRMIAESDGSLNTGIAFAKMMAAPSTAPEQQPQKLSEPAPSAEPFVGQPAAETPAVSQTAKSDGIEIMVCEDNEVNQIVFTQILESIDANFVIANNGEEGVELYQKHKPSLILMDVSMPKMNGLEATKAIREMEKETGIATPIIGVTAHAIKGDMEKCLEAGMNDYLSKPVSPDKLIAKIEMWMQQQSNANTA